MVNAAGGIDGHKLVIKEQDTAYTTEGTVRSTRAAVTSKSLVVQGLASPAINVLTPYMKTAKGSVWFPIADASLMAPLAGNFFSSNAYYSQTGAWAAQFLHSKVPSGKLAVVYQTGPTSEPGAKGAMYWMKQHGITPVSLSFSDTETDLSGLASKLQSSGVKGVFFWGVTPQFASFAHALANNAYKPTVVGTFGLAGAPTLKAAGSAAAGMYFDVLTLQDTQCVDGYKAAVNKYFPGELSPLTAQGWSAGALVVAGLRQAAKTHKQIDASALIDGLQHVSGTVGCTPGVDLSSSNHEATTEAAAVQVQGGT
jgi:ABC-type branched-subunit amino acid transport system substrate-binding protein